MSDMKMQEFVDHFEGLSFIDPKHTNHRLIEALFENYHRPKLRVSRLDASRGCGVTTTLIEWAKWIDAPVLAISGSPAPWKRARVPVKGWHASLRGAQPRPRLVLIDNPMTLADARSVVLSAKFEHWLEKFPFPALYVEQRHCVAK